MSDPDPNELVRRFMRRDPAEHGPAGEALVELGPEGVTLLVRCLRGGDEGSRQRAAEQVIRCGPAALPELTELAETCGPGVRARIAWILGNLEDRQAYALLSVLARDANASVRRQAMDAAGRHYEREPAGQESIDLLQQGLADADSSIRVRALQYLAARRDVRVIPGLIEALKDSHPSIREAAARALAVQRDARAVPALVQGLSDPGGSVRYAAARALGQIGGGEAIGPLATAVKSPDLNLAFQAAEALGNIGPLAAPALTELLKHSDKLVRNLAVGALRVIGARAVPALCEALRDREAAVRLSAAEALQHISREDPGPELLEAVPLLRRLRSVWSREIPPNVKTYDAALDAIEAATDTLKRLPLPAPAPRAAPVDLPLPAGPARSHAEDLPRPASEGEGASAGEVPDRDNWLLRLLRGSS